MAQPLCRARLDMGSGELAVDRQGGAVGGAGRPSGGPTRPELGGSGLRLAVIEPEAKTLEWRQRNAIAQIA